MKHRFQYIFHKDIPEDLDTDPDELSVEYETIKREWYRDCSRYRHNPNHHFHIRCGVVRDDQIIQICKIIDTWTTNPPKYFITREIHKKENHKFVDMAEAYFCPDCGVYCRTRNSTHIPFKIYQGLEQTIQSGYNNTISSIKNPQI